MSFLPYNYGTVSSHVFSLHPLIDFLYTSAFCSSWTKSKNKDQNVWKFAEFFLLFSPKLFFEVLPCHLLYQFFTLGGASDFQCCCFTHFCKVLTPEFWLNYSLHNCILLTLKHLLSIVCYSSLPLIKKPLI